MPETIAHDPQIIALRSIIAAILQESPELNSLENWAILNALTEIEGEPSNHLDEDAETALAKASIAAVKDIFDAARQAQGLPSRETFPAGFGGDANEG